MEAAAVMTSNAAASTIMLRRDKCFRIANAIYYKLYHKRYLSSAKRNSAPPARRLLCRQTMRLLLDRRLSGSVAVSLGRAAPSFRWAA